MDSREKQGAEKTKVEVCATSDVTWKFLQNHPQLRALVGELTEDKEEEARWRVCALGGALSDAGRYHHR